MPIQLGNVGAMGQTRKKRTPNFPIVGKLKPFGLYPIFAHPVLPGETLNRYTCKWRVVNKPIKYPLAGAWLETWLVYIKITDIAEALAQMFITTDMATTGYTAGSDSARYFHKTGQIKWVQMATETFHRKYFLDQGETARTIDGVPKRKMGRKDWMNNLMFKPADDALTTADVSEAQQEMDAFAMAQLMGLSELTYEQFLGQYGVRKAGLERMPEILRYAPSWTLPVNTVEPSTGIPSTTWMWQDAIELSKAKRFDEPGFVVMFASIKPKMFLAAQVAARANSLWGFKDWYPIYNIDDPLAGIRAFTSNIPELSDVRANAGEKEFWIDHNDLLAHGEQFNNSTDAPTTPFPIPLSNGFDFEDASTKQDIRGEYPLDTDIAALYASATATDQFAIYEGLASLDVTGHIKDAIR